MNATSASPTMKSVRTLRFHRTLQVGQVDNTVGARRDVVVLGRVV